MLGFVQKDLWFDITVDTSCFENSRQSSWELRDTRLNVRISIRTIDQKTERIARFYVGNQSEWNVNVHFYSFTSILIFFLFYILFYHFFFYLFNKYSFVLVSLNSTDIQSLNLMNCRILCRTFKVELPGYWKKWTEVFSLNKIIDKIWLICIQIYSILGNLFAFAYAMFAMYQKYLGTLRRKIGSWTFFNKTPPNSMQQYPSLRPSFYYPLYSRSTLFNFSIQ